MVGESKGGKEVRGYQIGVVSEVEALSVAGEVRSIHGDVGGERKESRGVVKPAV